MTPAPGTTFYRSRIDRWVYAVVAFSVAVCWSVSLIGVDTWLCIILAVIFSGFEIASFASVRYAISGNQLGIRNLWQWKWYPIDKIASARLSTSILSAPALSVHRISIRFTDRTILRTRLPLEISPIDRPAFIAALKAINPGIDTGR